MRKPFDTTCDVYKGPGTATPGLFVGTFPCRYVREDGIFAIGVGHIPIPAYMTIAGVEPVGMWTSPFLGIDPSLSDQVAIPSGTPPRWWIIYTDIIVWHVQPPYYRGYLAYLPYPTTPLAGGLLFGGAAVVTTIPPFLTYGGLLFGGAAVVTTIPPFLTYGGLLFGGAAVVTTIPPFLSFGGILLGGDTTDLLTRKRLFTGDGGMEFGGAAVVSFTPGVTYYWNDTFTDSNGTPITSHTGEFTPGGYTTIAGTDLQIQSNHLCPTDILGGNTCWVRFDHGQTAFTMTVQFHLSTIAQLPAGQRLRMMYRCQGSFMSNCWVEVDNQGGTDSIASYTVKTGFGTTIGTGTGTLTTGTTYTCVIVVTSTTVDVTINGVTVNLTDSTLNTLTKSGLDFTAFAVDTNQWYDSLTITP